MGEEEAQESLPEAAEAVLKGLRDLLVHRVGQTDLRPQPALYDLMRTGKLDPKTAEERK